MIRLVASHCPSTNTVGTDNTHNCTKVCGTASWSRRLFTALQGSCCRASKTDSWTCRGYRKELAFYDCPVFCIVQYSGRDLPVRFKSLVVVSMISTAVYCFFDWFSNWMICWCFLVVGSFVPRLPTPPLAWPCSLSIHSRLSAARLGVLVAPTLQCCHPAPLSPPRFTQTRRGVVRQSWRVVA